MRRAYISTADFRAPFDPVDFQGLGATKWPPKRSFWDTGHFRSPYDNGYFQNNQLFGVPPAVNMNVQAPALVRRYVASGEPVPTTLRDAAIPFNQVNRWVYAGMGALALGMGYRAYKRWKKDKSGQS